MRDAGQPHLSIEAGGTVRPGDPIQVPATAGDRADDPPIARVVVSGFPRSMAYPRNAQLARLNRPDPIADHELAALPQYVRFDIDISRDPWVGLINGKAYDPEQPRILKLGEAQTWYISSVFSHHPFHIHGAGRFLILSRDGVTEPNLTWKDTVLLPVGSTAEFLLELPSDLQVIEAAVAFLAEWCRSFAFGGPRLSLNFRVGITEALANAVLYGNREDPGKRIRVEACIDESRITIHVEDEGGGFDPRVVPDPTLPENLQRPGGRGLFLLRELMDEGGRVDAGHGRCESLRSDGHAALKLSAASRGSFRRHS